MMKKLIWFVLPFLLPACASWVASTPETERVSAIKSTPKPARREPGSLWSEDSRWNDLYATAPSRIVGDKVTIRVEDNLRNRVLQSMDGGSKHATADKDVKPEEAKPADAKVAENKTEEAKPSEPKSSEPAESKGQGGKQTVEATIEQILPRGTFVIQSNDVIRMGDKETRVALSGNIRERDIAADDTITSDAIFNLNLDSHGGGTGAPEKQEAAKEEPAKAEEKK